MASLPPERMAQINQALTDALGEPRVTMDWASVDDMRRDWIRRIAMHLAAATAVDTYDLASPGMRKQCAREAVLTAAALWLELERYFAAEVDTEQEAENHAGS